MSRDGNTDAILQDMRYALSESESKKVLAEFKIPVVQEEVAANEDEAVEISKKIGFPVVIKGLGATLTHKSEKGIVHLNVTDVDSVKKAVNDINQKAAEELEGFLIQPYIQGRREFVAGMFRDAQFGPVIMFGLGGVFTEALSDVVFRVAPLSEMDIELMTGEIKSKSLLGDFRGEKAVDMEQLTATLKGLSDISLKYPEIAEIDVNPLLVESDGSVCAVDALIIKEEPKQEKYFSGPVKYRDIEAFFNPKSIVFVGASGTMGKWGFQIPTSAISGNFEGEAYLVNPKGGTLYGKKVYQTIADIPGDIDLAVITISASYVMDLIPELKDKGIRNMLVISSGFAETGEAGKEMQTQLVQKAKDAGILIMGPNTAGICNPHINLYCLPVHVRPNAGSISFLTQSGNLGTNFLSSAQTQGIGIRTFCSSGNETMVTIEDFLEAFEEDDVTKTVLIYLESCKNGRRFFESAKRLSMKKPIILIKGGQSETGNAAAASHTGALTSDISVFNAVCEQTGIIKVNQMSDMLDLAASFSSLPLPNGNRTAVITAGGGLGVISADLCEQYGLTVPALSPEIIEVLNTYLPDFWSKGNPIDLVGEVNHELSLTFLEALMKWDGCDAIINIGVMGLLMNIEWMASSMSKLDTEYSEEYFKMAGDHLMNVEKEYCKRTVALMEKYNKPIYGVSQFHDGKIIYSVDNQKYKAVFFPTPEQAVKSLARMYEYKRFLSMMDS